MPPQLILLLCIVFILVLLRNENRVRGKLSAALWIPFLWFLIRGSRPVTDWFGGGFGGGVDGNPVEAVITLAFIAAAFFVLFQRQFKWEELPYINLAFFILLAFLAISCIWAPLPFVAFKRWFKEFGNVLIILVILTNHKPILSLRTVVIRCSYILLPLSIVLIKYFGRVGRSYGPYGDEMITGVTDQKNWLGLICCVFALFLVWDIVDYKFKRKERLFSRAVFPQVMIFLLCFWLLILSQSKTSLVGLLVGLCFFLSTYVPLVRRQPVLFARLGIVGVTSGLLMAGFGSALITPFLELLGRDATFTSRTPIWEAVLAIDTNPLIGTGFDGFWIKHYWDVFDLMPRHFIDITHSGYIDMYLNGGIIGVTLLVVALLTTLWRLSGEFSHEAEFARMFYVFVLIFVIMNFSESYFFKLGFMCNFFLVAMLTHQAVGDYRKSKTRERRRDVPVGSGYGLRI